jgi:hypothetical protein
LPTALGTTALTVNPARDVSVKRRFTLAPETIASSDPYLP